MARTPVFSALRRALLLAAAAEQRGVGAAEQVLAHAQREQARATLGRRRFLHMAGVSASSVLLPGFGAWGCYKTPTSAQPRIAIIGAGMAGLLCAHRLTQAGVDVQIFDASTRVGGRMWSVRDKLVQGQVAELGGELIDSGHRTLQRLAVELGLTLDDLQAGSAQVRAQTFYFGGRVLSELEIVNAFVPVARRLSADAAALATDPRAFARIDATNVAAYLDALPELDATLEQLLLSAYRGEFGLEPQEQSAWNLVSMLGNVPAQPFQVFGESDERFRTRGGNDQFPSRLAAKLTRQLQLDQRLVRVRGTGTTGYQAAFEHAGTTTELSFDKLVFALPWTQLRQVQLDVELPPQKRTMIVQLGYGTNSKLVGQFRSRVWRSEHAASGYVITDLSPQALWDSSWRQPGDAGLLTSFVGGKHGFALAAGSAEERMLGELDDIERIFPHTKTAYLPGSALRMTWPTAPHFYGSYACYRPGQAAWSGSEGARVGHLHFCGEHTSASFQGYMEGAAESGERVAREILADLGHK